MKCNSKLRHHAPITKANTVFSNFMNPFDFNSPLKYAYGHTVLLQIFDTTKTLFEENFLIIFSVYMNCFIQVSARLPIFAKG